MNKTLLSLTLGTLFAAGSALAVPVAQEQSQPQTKHEQGPDHGGRRMDPDRQLAMMTKQLNLSDEQQNQLRPILADRQQQMQALWSDQSLSREDRTAKMKTIREETHAKIEAVLNADQKTKFEQMHAQGREHHEHSSQQ